MEVWKDIPNYEGHYQVSNLGRVKSCDRKIKHPRGGFKFQKGYLSKLGFDNNGYRIIRIVKDKVGETYRVHRLVMLAFCGDSNLFVDHINHIKSDNRLENLRYVTPKENSHGYHKFKNPNWKEKIKKEPKPKFKDLPKNITYRKDTNKYAIRKKSGTEYKSFGSYNTLDEAIKKLESIIGI